MDEISESLPWSKLISPSTIIVGTALCFSAGVLVRLGYDWIKEGVRTMNAKKNPK